MAAGNSQMTQIVQITANVVILAVAEWNTSKYLQISTDDLNIRLKVEENLDVICLLKRVY